MKMREQASLWCKILALLCIVLALNALQTRVPEALGGLTLATRGGGLNLITLLYMVSPTILMSLFGVALWGISPFVASLMVPNEIVTKMEEDTSAFTPSFGGRATMRIALVVLGLWAFLQGSIGAGTALSLRTISAAASGSPNSVGATVVAMYEYQARAQMLGAVLHFVFGVLFLVLSGPISRRAFPD